MTPHQPVHLAYQIEDLDGGRTVCGLNATGEEMGVLVRSEGEPRARVTCAECLKTAVPDDDLGPLTDGGDPMCNKDSSRGPSWRCILHRGHRGKHQIRETIRETK